MELAWLLVVVAIAGMLFMFRLEDPRRILTGDSYWYMRQALVFSGVEFDDAAREAGRQYCRDFRRSEKALNRPDAPPCGVYDVSGVPDRYVAIFDSRPGYPLFAAPFVAVLGGWTGMMAATMVLALAAAALAYLAVWLASGIRMAGVLASVALYVLPPGFIVTRMLVEGAVICGYLAVIIGATLLWRGRRLFGIPLIAVALAWLFAVRSASGMAMALALIGAGLLALAVRGRRRTGLIITGLGVVFAVAWQALSAALDLPGLEDTIQDWATRHWMRYPEVPDPYGWLIDKNLEFWPRLWNHEPLVPVHLVVIPFAIVVLAIRMRSTATLWILTGLTGIPILVAHPVDFEYHRFMLPVWLPVAAALGCAGALAFSRRLAPVVPAGEPGGSPAEPVIPPAEPDTPPDEPAGSPDEDDKVDKKDKSAEVDDGERVTDGTAEKKAPGDRAVVE